MASIFRGGSRISLGRGHQPKRVKVHSGGSKGGARDAPSPGGPNCFNFMQFLEKYGNIVCWRPPPPTPPPGVGAPSLSKYWIRRWCQPIINQNLPKNCVKMKKVGPREVASSKIFLCRSANDFSHRLLYFWEYCRDGSVNWPKCKGGNGKHET